MSVQRHGTHGGHYVIFTFKIPVWSACTKAGFLCDVLDFGRVKSALKETFPGGIYYLLAARLYVSVGHAG